MKNRLCLFCFLWIMAGAGAEAQSSAVFDHPLSSAALPRYAALCAELAGRPLVKGSFEQTKTIARLNRSLVSRGEFLIAGDLGMVWETKSPFPSTMTLGRDFIIQSLPGGTRTKLDAGGNEIFLSLADTMGAVFSGKVQILREKFDNYFTETEAGGGTIWTLGLKPKDTAVRSFAERIIMSGTSGGGKQALIRSIVIHERSGGSVTYTLSEHRFPAALGPDDKAYFSL
jgi:hypothetical protein